MPRVSRVQSRLCLIGGAWSITCIQWTMPNWWCLLCCFIMEVVVVSRWHENTHQKFGLQIKLSGTVCYICYR